MSTEHTSATSSQNYLVPCILDRLARERPDATFGVWPKDSGFYTVTYAQLANVVNGLAWWFVEQIGPGKLEGENREIVTYIGPNDLRYTAVLLAAVKAGYGARLLTAQTVLLTSPRNSPEAHRALFDSLKCRTLVTTDPSPPAVLSIVEAIKPRMLTTPGLEVLLETKYPEYPYDKTLEVAGKDPLFIIHTSGSTGIPKPITWTQDAAARQLESVLRKAPDGAGSLDHFFHGKRVMITLPPFHGAGLAQYVFNAICSGMIPIVSSTAPLPTAQAVVDALKHMPADVLLLAPSLVAELAQSPELLDYCANHLKMIMYIGGDLPKAIGDRVASRILLRCQWGASEVGIAHQLMPPELGPADWRYIRFHPCVGAVFEEVTNGNYELVIRRDEALISTQPTWSIRGINSIETEYRTRDLFEPHPTVSNAWRWRARADDIIVFLNGEKTNPVSMEQHIVASNSELGGAIVIGAQRFQTALLIEPSRSADFLTTAEQAALIERIWPSVEEANRAAPAHARVEKSMILLTTPDRPLIRAGKGTIQRSSSVTQYEEEIENLYANADVVPDDEDDGVPIDPADVDEITRVIRACVCSVTDWSTLGDSDNFFNRGMDSLQGLRLARALRRTLSRPGLALSMIYQNPTASGLAAAMAAQEGPPDEREAMEPLLAAYRKLIYEIPAPKSVSPKREDGPVDVILTGSTGQVGTFVLHALLDRPGIGHIFCLSRSQDGGRSVQHERFAAAGLRTEGLGDRVSFVQVDTARPKLGLDDATYETLRERAGLLIHNAWPVNFNLPLSAFQPQLAGLVNVFGLAAAAISRPMRVVFVSSISAVAGRPPTDGPAPEAVLESPDTPYPSGYARSKFLSEQLCEAAAQHLGLSVVVARLGQVAGAVRGRSTWSRAEWLPSLVMGSLLLGCLPNGVGPLFSAVDFVPADILGDIMVDLATTASAARAGASVFNLRNPRATPWAALLPAIVDAARDRLGKTLEIVPPLTWLARLHDSEAAATADPNAAAAANPALKLFNFYRNIMSAGGDAAPPMAIEHALAASAALRGLPPVELEWMRKWVEGWIE